MRHKRFFRDVGRRISAVALAITLAVPSGLAGITQAHAAADETEVTAEQTQGEAGSVAVQADTENPGDINVSVEWGDSEFKDGDSMKLYDESNNGIPVKLRIKYSSAQVRAEGYKSGELKIKLKGIGGYGDSYDKEGSTNQRAEKIAAGWGYDWDYSWDKETDTYTLWNNNDISGSEALDGYIELEWSVRNAICGYSQDDISATVLYPDGPEYSGNALYFSIWSLGATDEIEVNQFTLNSTEGLDKYITGSADDYIWVRYQVSGARTPNARTPYGIFENNEWTKKNSGALVFNPDASGVGSGAVVIPRDGTLLTDNVSKYVPEGISGTAIQGHKYNTSYFDEYTLYVAYPKAEYAGKEISVSATSSALLRGGRDDGTYGPQILGEKTGTFTVPESNDWNDGNNTIYLSQSSMTKDNINFTYNNMLKAEQVDGFVKAEDFINTDNEQGFKLTVYTSRANSGQVLDVEIGCDAQTVMQKDGNYRMLGSDEYEYTSVKIPGGLKNGNNISLESYPVCVYAAQNGKTLKKTDDNLVFEGNLSEEAQTVSFPDNTTAFCVIVKNMRESLNAAEFETSVLYHLKDVARDNLATGTLNNIAYVRGYAAAGEADEKVEFTGSERLVYQDSAAILEESDEAIYGCKIDRAPGELKFYEAALSEIAETRNIMASGRTDTQSLNVDFNGEDDVYLTKFDWVLDLPSSLTVTGMNKTGSFLNCVAMNIREVQHANFLKNDNFPSVLDEVFSEDILKNHCTEHIVKNYDGRGGTKVILSFDFSDLTIPQDYRVNLDIPFTTSRIYYENRDEIEFNTYTLVPHEDKNPFPFFVFNYSNLDSYYDASDENMNQKEELMYTNSYTLVFNKISSGQWEMATGVSTPYTDDFVYNFTVTKDYPTVKSGDTYTYDLLLRTGNSILQNAVLYDTIETDGKWAGTFQSVDLSYLEAAGITGTVYYSESDAPDPDLTSGDWSTSLEPEKVKSIAIDLSGGEVPAGSTLDVLVNMTAPTDAPTTGIAAGNHYTAIATVLDGTSGTSAIDSNLTAPPAYVAFEGAKVESTHDITINKTAADTGAALQGATFQAYEKADDGSRGAAVSDAVTTDENGVATIKGLPDGTYLIAEVTAPEGYKVADATEITLSGTDSNISLDIVDEAEEKPAKTIAITVEQNINTDDINTTNGTPAFIVKVINNATGRTYQDIIVYDKKEIEEYENTTLHKNITFKNLPEGEYTVTQVPVSRYLSVIENSESASTTVEVHDDISVSYIATRYEGQNYSDSGTAE